MMRFLDGFARSQGSLISILLAIFWRTLNQRLEAQDRIVEGLEVDIERMSKGCGLDGCHWRVR